MSKLILFGLAFLLIPASNVFGVPQTHIDDNILVFVQTTIRNSDGTLVVYLESTKFSYLDVPTLGLFLDHEASLGSDPIITVDGQQYQVIRRAQSQSFNSEKLVASVVLSVDVDEKYVLLARFAHDGYLTIPGDTMESMWTFVRPIS